MKRTKTLLLYPLIFISLALATFIAFSSTNGLLTSYAASATATETKTLTSTFTAKASSSIDAIFIGDSFAAGYGLGEKGGKSADVKKGWATKLANQLNIKAQITAVSGSGFSQHFTNGEYFTTLIKRAKSNVGTAAKKVKLVVLAGGVNDCFALYGTPKTRPSYASIYKAAKKTCELLNSSFPQAKIVVVPMLETHGTTKYTKSQQSTAYKAICAGAQAAGGGTAVDYLMRGAYDWLREISNVTIAYDHWHPNVKGNALIAQAMAKRLKYYNLVPTTKEQ